jgi:hypothetical protein
MEKYSCRTGFRASLIVGSWNIHSRSPFVAVHTLPESAQLKFLGVEEDAYHASLVLLLTTLPYLLFSFPFFFPKHISHPQLAPHIPPFTVPMIAHSIYTIKFINLLIETKRCTVMPVSISAAPAIV